LWQQDSTAIAIRCEADGNTKLTVKDHGVVLACATRSSSIVPRLLHTPTPFMRLQCLAREHCSCHLSTAPGLFRRTHTVKIRTRLEFHFCSRMPVNSLAIVQMTRWGTPPLGGLYIGCWVWVRNHTIVPPLPDAVVGNAPL
jgi:hypothetical protein